VWELPRSNDSETFGESSVKKIGLKSKKTRRSTGTNFFAFFCGYRPSEPSKPHPRKVILEMVSPLDLIPEYFPLAVKERLGIKEIPTPSAGIKKEKKGAKNNFAERQKEKDEKAKNQLVSLSRQMLTHVITVFKENLKFNQQDISKK
jgi:hypothetical protein